MADSHNIETVVKAKHVHSAVDPQRNMMGCKKNQERIKLPISAILGSFLKDLYNENAKINSFPKICWQLDLRVIMNTYGICVLSNIMSEKLP